MKKYYILFSIIFNSVFALAFYDNQTCKERLNDSAWPNDKFKFVLNCNLESQTLGNLHKNLCVAAILTERSVYKNTEVHFLSSAPGTNSMHRDFILLNENNEAVEGSKFYTEEDQLVFENTHSNTMMSNNWTHQYKGSFLNNSILYFKNINERIILPKQVTESGEYRCHQEI